MNARVSQQLQKRTRKRILDALLLIAALAALGGFFYGLAPVPGAGLDRRAAAVDGLLFLFAFIWTLAVLPRWRSTKALCAGSLLFLAGSFTAVGNDVFAAPRRGEWLSDGLFLALGAGLMAWGVRAWMTEKNDRLAQIQAERDFEASLLPKLSHDLRVPLTNMIGMTGIVESDSRYLDDPTRRREYSELMMRAANDLNFLIDNVLETYRIKSDTLRLAPSAVSLAELLDESLKDFYYQAKKKQLTLVRDFPAADVELEADRVKIARVIQNLLANAIKFSPRGGAVTVRARAQDGRVTIRVVDEGPGVPQELLGPLFDEGGAAPQREFDDAESFGLGLKVVREFVRLHNGRFWTEPNYPSGAQFCFSLPQWR